MRRYGRLTWGSAIFLAVFSIGYGTAYRLSDEYVTITVTDRGYFDGDLIRLSLVTQLTRTGKPLLIWYIDANVKSDGGKQLQERFQFDESLVFNIWDPTPFELYESTKKGKLFKVHVVGWSIESLFYRNIIGVERIK